MAVEVLVVGAGACGCTAALAAHGGGAQVMVLERDATPSGNTSLSGGQIPAGGSRLQKLAGIDAAAQILVEDLRTQATESRIIDWDVHRRQRWPVLP